MEPVSRRDAVITKMRQLLNDNPRLGRRALARMINDEGVPTTTWEVRQILKTISQPAKYNMATMPKFRNVSELTSNSQGIYNKNTNKEPEPVHSPIITHTGPAPEVVVLNALKRGAVDIATLTELTKMPYSGVLLGIANLRATGHNVHISEDASLIVSLRKEPEIGGAHVIDVASLRNDPYTFGWVSDTHLCSRYQRLDALNAIYDIFEREGIRDVYHGGNYIDGEAKFNTYDLIVHGITGQVDYFIENYPKREGVQTLYIAGDDHEGWFAQREGINIGKYTEQQALSAGRDDLHYLGYMEADVALKAKNGQAMMKIVHPGGGSSYAYSYKSQKIIESLQPGEKPQIMLIGHLHKFDHTYPRGVHAIQIAAFQDQTPFMRKKNLESHIGGGITSVRLDDNGTITSFRVEFIPFYDRGFYQNYNRF